MQETIWENQITLNSNFNGTFEVIDPVKAFYNSENSKVQTDISESDILKYVDMDTSVLPSKVDREGYFGDDHFSYWLSGLRDFGNLHNFHKKYGDNKLLNYLDIGCASGRVVRHANYLLQDTKVYGADINLKHIEWMKSYLPSSLLSFQNTSLPYFPFESNQFDLISAFSVFTHVESFIDSWLLEIKRITKPGGIIYITLQTDETFKNMTPLWPVYKSLKNHPEFNEDLLKSDMTKDKLTFRWGTGRSYSSNVFYKTSYIQKNWGKVFDIVEVKRMFPAFQDVIIMKKR